MWLLAARASELPASATRSGLAARGWSTQLPGEGRRVAVRADLGEEPLRLPELSLPPGIVAGQAGELAQLHVHERLFGAGLHLLRQRQRPGQRGLHLRSRARALARQQDAREREQGDRLEDLDVTPACERHCLLRRRARPRALAAAQIRLGERCQRPGLELDADAALTRDRQ